MCYSRIVALIYITIVYDITVAGTEYFYAVSESVSLSVIIVVKSTSDKTYFTVGYGKSLCGG